MVGRSWRRECLPQNVRNLLNMKKNNDHPGGCPPFVSTFTIRPANWLLSAERPGLPSGLGHYPEAVQTHAPPGSVPAVEYVEPSFTAEAEALMKGNTGDGGAQSLTALTKQHTAFPLGLPGRTAVVGSCSRIRDYFRLFHRELRLRESPG
jgi:hypothetical protein